MLTDADLCRSGSAKGRTIRPHSALGLSRASESTRLGEGRQGEGSASRTPSLHDGQLPADTPAPHLRMRPHSGTPFTRFTGTKVQILTQKKRTQR
jgi:hypothetical protein